MRRLICSAVAMAALSAPMTATAATSAYWRHEDGPNGALIPAGPGTVPDSSGTGSHMRTFNPTFTSASYTNVVSPVPLRSGASNNFSLDFGPGGDDAGNNDDNFSEGASVNSVHFAGLTVELAFRMDTVNGYQALVGKDGKPIGSSPVPPFKLMVRGDDFPDAIPNQLFIEWIDGDATATDVHFLASGFTVQANQWYHVAFTSSATDAQLWIAGETGPYALVDSLAGQDLAGASGDVLVFDPTNWSVGRGMFNNGVADWSDAHIDEVRISDTVLAPNEFLFNPVPEPSTAGLLALGGAFAMCVRRRNK